MAREIDRYFLQHDTNYRRVDRAWTYYEARLGPALDRLTEGSGADHVDTLLSLTVLVPFMAGLLVRSPDFDRRYAARFEMEDATRRLYSMTLTSGEAERIFKQPHEVRATRQARVPTEEERPDNANLSRLMELQRLLLPIATARWVVLHTAATAPSFVLPDTGYLPGGPQSIVENCAMTVPIGPHAALALGHRWWNKVGEGDAGRVAHSSRACGENMRGRDHRGSQRFTASSRGDHDQPGNGDRRQPMA